jgi:pimeloyl-ACP methyl ester carboxylesterase
MIRDKFVHHNNSTLHYAVAGSGPRSMLIFHGFGQDMNVFEYLSSHLAQHYTFYVFDLYFHGKSTWRRGEQTLEKAEWRQIVQIFLSENNVADFSLAGFSLGGKFVLATFEAFPQRIKEVFLIAPDGIKTSFWYSMATYPTILRNFFKSMIMRPERFMSIARFLNTSGFVDKGLIRFAEYQMNNEEKRTRVYYSWVVFRHLTVNLDSIARLMNENGVRLTMIVGKYDKVITPSNMNRLLSKVNDRRLEILESGHTGLINQSIPFFLDTV